jgi:hypothetical protein
MTGKINVGKKVTEHQKVIMKKKSTLSSQASDTNE